MGQRGRRSSTAPPALRRTRRGPNTLHGQRRLKVKGRIAALRAKQRGGGHDLTQREARALAGDWYREFISQHEENPGRPRDWQAACWDLEGVMEEAARDPETGEIGELDMTDPDTRKYVEKQYPYLSKAASEFLISRGEILTPTAMAIFLDELMKEMRTALLRLQRVAGGDYSLDHHLQMLPQYRKAKPDGQHSAAVTGDRTSPAQRPSAVRLLEAYCRAKQTSPRTLARWRCVFTALDALPAQEAVRDRRGAQRWLDSLVGAGTPPRGHRTVRETWLSACNAVFGWGVQHDHVEVNPFEKCKVEVPRQTSTREAGKAFTDDEAVTILSAALRVEAVPWGRQEHHWAAVRRWVPWLLAYTGARVGELAQLRTQDIERRDCGPVLRITPDAGTVKTGKARTVPIHVHLVEMGLLDYVEAVAACLGKQGPLFYRPQTKAPSKPPADWVSERLARWVRDLGITDPAVQPNHGWRHLFKQRARKAGIEPGIRDAICGHKPRGVAEAYEHATVEEMADAMRKFPRYQVE